MADFENLSKEIATTVSRRRALRLMVGGIGGTVLAAFGSGTAMAFPNECAIICNQPFFGGPAKAACMQTCKRCQRQGGTMCGEFTCCAGQTPECCFGICCPTGTCCATPEQPTCCPPGTECRGELFEQVCEPVAP